MVEFGRRVNAEVRFIEYMDVGGATRWRWEDVVTRARDARPTLAAHYGPLTPIDEASAAPADRFRLPDGTIFGVDLVDDRAVLRRRATGRALTADGLWLLCLYAADGLDLRTPLRGGAHQTRTSLGLIARTVAPAATDRGAEAPAGRGRAAGA